MSLYIVRAQGLGYITSAVFDGEPSEAQLRDVLREELRHHGVHPVTGELRSRWVRAEPIAVIRGGGGAQESSECLMVTGKLSIVPKLEAPTPSAATPNMADTSTIEMVGVGEVKNPEPHP